MSNLWERKVNFFQNVSVNGNLSISSLNKENSCSKFKSQIIETKSDCDQKCWPAPFGFSATISTTIFLSTIMVITIFGNILVLIAFSVEKKLRQPKNFFIVSLAITDLLIGIISLPLFTLYIMVGFWPSTLGPILCDLWLSLDHTVCLVSQLTVLSITIDRFYSVRYPTDYQALNNESKSIFIIIATWVISALIFFIPIFGWEHFVGERSLLPGECKVQFLQDPIFNTSLIITYFWIPLIIMTILYALIFRTAWTLSKKAIHKRESRLNLLNRMNQTNNDSRPKVSLQIIPLKHSETSRNDGGIERVEEHHQIKNEAPHKEEGTKRSRPRDQLRKWWIRQIKHSHHHEGKAKKALWTISMILGAFLVCWTPYHVIAILGSFYPSLVNINFYLISYFLCYANSCINPFCYAASNRQFKDTFKRLIVNGDFTRK